MESNNNKNIETIKFLCSYGRKILPCYIDGTLRYAGGLTWVFTVDRSMSFTARRVLWLIGESSVSIADQRLGNPNFYTSDDRLRRNGR